MDASQATATGSITRPRRRWRFQFSVRSFLIFSIVLCVLFATVGNFLVRLHRQRDVVRRIQRLGGSVLYEHDQHHYNPSYYTEKPARWMTWIRDHFGNDLFTEVVVVQLVGTERLGVAKNEDLAILNELPKLREVILRGPIFNDDGMTFVAKFPQLSVVVLWETQVTSAGLKQLRSAKNLVSMMLIGDHVDDEMLRGIVQLQRLEYLKIYRSRITSNGLVPIGQLTGLRELAIMQCREIDEFGLPHLADLTNLEVVRWDGDLVSDEGLRHVAKFRRLRSIDLSYTKVSDIGIQHLAELPNVTHLRLRNTLVGDDGLAAIAKMKSLRVLEVASERVTDSGLVHLLELPNLTHLRVESPAITDAGILSMNSLRDAIPVCAIQVTKPRQLEPLDPLKNEEREEK